MTLRLSSLGILAILATAACGSDEASSNSSETPGGAAAPSQDPGSGEAAQRAISEADIVQIDDQKGRLYAMSRSGSLAIVDVSTPGRLALLGKVSIVGEPFEMYRRGDTLLAMTNGGLRADGSYEAPVSSESAAPARDLSAGGIVAALDVSDPKSVKTIESYKISGEIADSRLVGNVLYLATYETGSCWQCTQGPRTLVTSFDVSKSSALVPVDQVAFASPDTGGMSLAWSTPWKRSIVVTPERMYVGGLAETSTSSTSSEGRIEVLDIRDPAGHLVRAGSFETAGPIMSRWQLDEYQGVVRVISQRGAGSTANGSAYPEIETFRVGESTFEALGTTTMKLPRQEGLKTVRFDGPRAYAITFNQTDPLFALDLSDPARPLQRGELHMPGWMFHLVPRGDRLIGLGLDRTDSSGSLNVSLFDVSDMESPTLIKRVPFGPTGLYEDYQITNGVIAEDQDRIQKAFSISSDGLIAVPFSGKRSCSGADDGGVQLLELRADTLSLRALLPVQGNPRRALRHQGELLAVSDSHVRAFSLSRIDVAKQTAEVEIGACTLRSNPQVGGWAGDDGRYYDDDHGYRHCSMGVPSSTTSWPLGIGIALAAIAISRRRRAA